MVAHHLKASAIHLLLQKEKKTLFSNYDNSDNLVLYII